MDAYPPALIAINHDDHHADLIGHTGDGRQFFITTPFEPYGHEFVALYLFNREGQLLEAKIDDFGPRATCDESKRTNLVEQRLRELGPVTFGRIEVAPFSVSRFGLAFGQIPRGLDGLSDEDAAKDVDWRAVELLPGNYMAFFPPWDSGDYDT